MAAEPSPARREDPCGPDARPIPDAAPEADEPPKVTVVIPVYNREKYIGAAIESVLAQTFTDFEILVIDDGSTDGSREVVRSYPDPRILLSCHDGNLGVARTRNDGVRLARGEYLAFLDSDDIAYPERLARQVAFLDRHPDHGAVGAWVDWMDGEGRVLRRVKRKAVSPNDIAAQRLFRSGIENSASMARTAVLRDYAFNEQFALGEDFDLWARIAADHKLANLPRVLVRRRAHDQRTSREWAGRKQEQRQAIYASQLSALGVQFTDMDLQRHFLLRRMHKLDITPDREFLEWGEDWLLKLRAANERARCYPEPAFSRVLGGVWFRLCWRASAGLGWRAWRAFWTSPLRHSAWAGLWKDISLKAPRPFARAGTGGMV